MGQMKLQSNIKRGLRGQYNGNSDLLVADLVPCNNLDQKNVTLKPKVRTHFPSNSILQVTFKCCFY